MTVNLPEAGLAVCLPSNVVGMLITCLRLTSVLNALASGHLTAPEAEAEIRVLGQPHHVVDPDQVLGLQTAQSVPIRSAFARLDSDGQRASWALAAPRPGRLAGLRGPAVTTAAALQAGAVVIRHTGGVAWVPFLVGPAVQWTLLPADPPLLPAPPATASRALAETVLEVERDLAALGAPAGSRPGQRLGPRLGPAYPYGAQLLLEKALALHEACRYGLQASNQLFSSHEVTQREQHLQRLDGVCLDTICSVASWPVAAQAAGH